METVKYILALPDYIDNVGYIYPIRLKDYDLFSQCTIPLYYSKFDFDEEIQHYPLLDLIVTSGLQNPNIIHSLQTLFSLATRKKVTFALKEDSLDDYSFVIDDEHSITRDNYDVVRQTLMKQNLIFEQKKFKNKIVAEWAEKVIKARAKNGIKMTIEDMISTVSIYKGASYDDLAEQTLYQLNADFQRLNKFKSYDTSISLASVAGVDKLEHFASELNLFKNPYDDLFVSKDKLNKLDSAMT